MKKISLIVVVFFLFIVSFFAIMNKIDNSQAYVPSKISYTVILDAGHGGEDGGAVAKDGTAEKNINLQITENLSVYFDIFGIEYITVRDSDTAVGDVALKTVRERKVSDLHNRMDLVNSTPGAILLSIHQNFYLSDKYSGTQVFYAKNVSGSDVLAQNIQTSVASLLQPDNTRQIKPTEGTVFLLDKAQKVSVMVECGFLSNGRELSLLKDSYYQTMLSFSIVRGLQNYLYSEKGYL